MAKKHSLLFCKPVDRQTSLGISHEKTSEPIAKYKGCLHGRSQKDYQKRLRIAVKMVKNIKRLKLTCHDCKKIGLYTRERCLICNASKKEVKEIIDSSRRRPRVKVEWIKS